MFVAHSLLLIRISYAEEDSNLAEEISLGLEAKGYTTWYYERDSIPGLSYLIQLSQAIQQAEVVVLIISPHSINSHQVTKEVEWTHEFDKPVIPLLLQIKREEYITRQRKWAAALGTTTSLTIPTEGISAVLPRILRGLGRIMEEARERRERGEG